MHAAGGSPTLELLDRLHDGAAAAARPFDEAGRFALFLSASDGKSRVVTVNATEASFADAWRSCCNELALRQPHSRWLRCDWAEDLSPLALHELEARLQQSKRNYFRSGIALDGDLRRAFLEVELNANAMLYGGGQIEHAVVNRHNFQRYAARRYPHDEVDLRPEAAVWLFTTGAVFLAAGDPAPVSLHARGRNAGRRQSGPLTVDNVEGLIASGADYLARQVGPDGCFAYGWHPCFDRSIRAYNSLRHASTLHAMLEAWEVSPSAGLAAAIERATDYLVTHLVRRVTRSGRQMAFVVEGDGEIKLGASGVCLLALVKQAELFATDRHRALLEALGEGILYMQDRETGGFSHVLHFPSLEVKERFRIIYYDGEAAFGLVRLYGLTRDARWLDAVERAFGYFLRQGHWRAHDHWLGYASAELVRHRPREAYFRFGLRNVRSHLDFVLERITTFPTLLELMVSSAELIAILRQTPGLRRLLREIDLPTFYETLHFRAHYLLNGHFWPELAMFFERPERIVGSFFIRHHAFRVRTDDVEHYLSGLVGYRKFLREHGATRPADPGRLEWQARDERCWNARNLPLASGGVWHVPPPSGWSAQGVCIHREGFLPGRMAAIRLRADERGWPLRNLLPSP